MLISILSPGLQHSSQGRSLPKKNSREGFVETVLSTEHFYIAWLALEMYN
jgi:hypothetical protein